MLSAKIQSMDEVIREMLFCDKGNPFADDAELLFNEEMKVLFGKMIGESNNSVMYVARNSSCINETSVMLYDGIIRFY